MSDRAERILDAICEDVDHRLNPSGDDCPECAGEGGTYDCFDGCCLNAEEGCPDCFYPCEGCRIYERDRRKAIREEVVQLGDVEVAIAWLKSVERWRDDITADQVRTALERERATMMTPKTAG